MPDPTTEAELGRRNGWGDYEGALAYLRRLAEACAQHPKCTIGIWA